MSENLKTYSFTNTEESEELKPFIGCPDKLSSADREELIYRFQYGEETSEFLAIEYRLTPSKLNSWLEEKNIKPIDLTDPAELEKFESYLEHQKRIKVARLHGAVLAHLGSSWEKISRTEQKLLSVIENSANSMAAFTVVDPKVVCALTRAHTAMTKQMFEILASGVYQLAVEENGEKVVFNVNFGSKEIVTDQLPS